MSLLYPPHLIGRFTQILHPRHGSASNEHLDCRIYVHVSVHLTPSKTLHSFMVISLCIFLFLFFHPLPFEMNRHNVNCTLMHCSHCPYCTAHGRTVTVRHVQLVVSPSSNILHFCSPLAANPNRVPDPLAPFPPYLSIESSGCDSQPTDVRHWERTICNYLNPTTIVASLSVHLYVTPIFCTVAAVPAALLQLPRLSRSYSALGRVCST
jgi:hypothetical protein